MNVYQLANHISRISPGQRVQVAWSTLRDAAPPMPLLGWGGPMWTSAERIMENIVGSAHEFRFWEDLPTGAVTFERLKQPLSGDTRTYVSPDRREYYTLDSDGFWRPKRKPTADETG
jgi:hypothetical protein